MMRTRSVGIAGTAGTIGLAAPIVCGSGSSSGARMRTPSSSADSRGVAAPPLAPPVPPDACRAMFAAASAASRNAAPGTIVRPATT
eukprot:363041-Chlamydomonas_euryale.AAC.5